MDLFTEHAYLEDLGKEVNRIFDYCVEEYGKQELLGKSVSNLDLFKELQSKSHKQFVDAVSRLSKKYTAKKEEEVHRDCIIAFWGYYYAHRIFSRMLKKST